MKKLEINTTQNVTIEYELASLGERMISFCIDLIIVLVGASVILGIFYTLFDFDNELITFIIYILPLFLYNLLSEIFMNGQSLGKKAVKIKVIKLDGSKPNSFDFMTRWAFRLIDIGFSIGIIAIQLIISTGKSQRLGDFLADMVVIRVNPKSMLNFNWIANKYSSEDYFPKYPQIKNLKESELLTIKKVMDQSRKYKNAGHSEALDLVVIKIEEQLGITAPPNKIEFLNQLIKDYVYLTR